MSYVVGMVPTLEQLCRQHINKFPECTDIWKDMMSQIPEQLRWLRFRLPPFSDCTNSNVNPQQQTAELHSREGCNFLRCDRCDRLFSAGWQTFVIFPNGFYRCRYWNARMCEECSFCMQQIRSASDSEVIILDESA
jgi:hypothetical protein